MIQRLTRFCQEVPTLKRLFLLLLCLLVLCGCSFRAENDNGFLIFENPTDLSVIDRSQSEKTNEIRCCWLSYPELNPQQIRQQAAYRAYLQTLFAPLQRLKITDLFVQVRPFCDAIYPSKLFEPSKYVTGKRGEALSFDYLSVILDEAKRAQMRVHAWINPYRLAVNAADLRSIHPESKTGRLLQQETNATIQTADGVFLQPGSASVQRLILDGVRELLSSYPVAGIHIDDYFYPKQTGDQDQILYQNYTKQGGSLPKDAWRREQISLLVRSLYRVVHAVNSDCVFSVSPGGNLKETTAAQYADIELWGKEDGYCDWLMPQLYFGFRHETIPFLQLAGDWKRLCINSNIRLIGGLALYKAGKEDPYAGKGRAEWVNHSDVLARQVQQLRKLGYDGFVLYSAHFVNFQEKACQMLESVL